MEILFDVLNWIYEKFGVKVELNLRMEIEFEFGTCPLGLYDE